MWVVFNCELCFFSRVKLISHLLETQNIKEIICLEIKILLLLYKAN